MFSKNKVETPWAYRQKIFITGGAGFIGKALIDKLYPHHDIVIYSRDESKHYYLKKQFHNVKCVVGDVSDYDSMARAAYGCHRGIYAASMKQIEACDENPLQAARTIMLGAINSRNVTDEMKMVSGTFVSTDKSRAATTVYGALKFAAGESFILNADEEMGSSPQLSTLIYGNVLNSTGSIIPLIWKSIEAKRPLTLYGEDMTRFMITKDEAVRLIMASPYYHAVNLIPQIPSFKVIDLFEIYAEKFGLQYEVGTPRVGEKIHEVMIAQEEVPRTHLSKHVGFPLYVLQPKGDSTSDSPTFPNNEFSSRDSVLTRSQLSHILEGHGFFLPVR